MVFSRMSVHSLVRLLFLFNCGIIMVTATISATSVKDASEIISSAIVDSLGSSITQFFGHSYIPDNYRECMDNGVGSYYCTTDPVRARRIFDEGRVLTELDELYSMGVVQTVDGTEAEKEAIEEIITRMTEYFYGEVMTKTVYEGVRHKWYVCRRGPRNFDIFSYHDDELILTPPIVVLQLQQL